jgi:MFS family permease
LHVSDFGIGFLFAVYAIAGLLTAIPVGILSDRWGRKPFVLFGMFAMAGAFVFYAFARSYPVLVVARALDGVTAAATWSAALALLGDRFDEKEMGGHRRHSGSSARGDPR